MIIPGTDQSSSRPNGEMAGERYLLATELPTLPVYRCVALRFPTHRPTLRVNFRLMIFDLRSTTINKKRSKANEVMLCAFREIVQVANLMLQ